MFLDRIRILYLFRPHEYLNYFEASTPTEYASFMYDAIMTAGISACQSLASTADDQHIDHVLRTEFSGASGPFRFKDGTNLNGEPIKENFRDPEHSIFGIYNIRPGVVDDDGMQRCVIH